MPTFILFTGHNDRAVIALARFFERHGLRWHAIASGPEDAIHRTAHAHRVLCNRVSRDVDVAWLAALALQLRRDGEVPAYCPTTEFINALMLSHRQTLEHAGWQLGLPDAALYDTLTSKAKSPDVIERLCGVPPPPALDWDAADAPCVAKPRRNLRDGQGQYPILCLTPAEWAAARTRLEPDEWFVQRYVDAQSYYLCAYVGRSGAPDERAWYWQENLMQQPKGKSIVLARTCGNPGLDAERLLDGLAALGYHGPLMIEVMRAADGALHYIETNPRFWGPLQLALDACPALLAQFAKDHGATLPSLPPAPPGPHYYAWAHGAAQTGNRHFAALDDLPAARNPSEWLRRYDLYDAADTAALHLTH